MIVAGQRLPILIATRPVDFRCGHQALALMVQTELKLDPHSGVWPGLVLPRRWRSRAPTPDGCDCTAGY
ncbi:transposase [Pararhizobium capsulatum DSM 1112]|uniref:Transposase n=1 Tax=Pararhizobium capsulatum DSM 1112 TaxID=1121113 RepID=A0ABU0BYP9_9HYPH|nr:transposase [Pararhizobium capsulatum DSM 1112]